MILTLLASKHVEIQKDHLELKENNVQLEKVKYGLHNTVQRVYQRVSSEGEEVGMEDKVKKVDSTINELQTQV